MIPGSTGDVPRRVPGELEDYPGLQPRYFETSADCQQLDDPRGKTRTVFDIGNIHDPKPGGETTDNKEYSPVEVRMGSKLRRGGGNGYRGEGLSGLYRAEGVSGVQLRKAGGCHR